MLEQEVVMALKGFLMGVGSGVVLSIFTYVAFVAMKKHMEIKKQKVLDKEQFLDNRFQMVFAGINKHTEQIKVLEGKVNILFNSQLTESACANRKDPIR